MDRLESLSNTLSQITLYDIKSMYNQAKNVVLNVSEMEAKVREATNDEPWGASSTLMQDIAAGTFNFQTFNEIMPSIYARFMEKEARQWRQIYKALQLLEYLIKHGSERVVDDARSHVSTIKMLRNFHYIDDRGKDEGVNVRNRSRELTELLSDVDRIRSERRKAKANKHKYIGTGNDGFGGGYGGFSGFGSSGGSGSGGGGGDSYSGGGGGYDREYSGGSSGGFRDDSGRRGYEEYNAGDDEERSPRRSNSAPTSTSPPVTSPITSRYTSSTSRHASTSSTSASARTSTTITRNKPAAPPAPAPVQVFDLLGGLDDEDGFGGFGGAGGGLATDKALPAVGGAAAVFDAADDDFDDFQAAPASPTATTTNMSTTYNKPNLMEMLSAAPTSMQSKPAPVTQGSFFGQLQPAVPAASSQSTSSSLFGAPAFGAQPATRMAPTPMMTPSPMSLTPSRPATSNTNTMSPTRQGGAASPAAGKGTTSFDDLWNLSKSALGAKAAGNTGGAAGAGKSIKDLQNEKAQASIWGGLGSTAGAGRGVAGGMGMGMGGGFGSIGAGTGAGAGANMNSGGDDDLLL